MSKKTKRLEKENLNLTRKQEATNKNIFQMAEERSQSQQAIDKLTRENDKLKKLCRAMQTGGYNAAGAAAGPQGPGGGDEFDEALEGETESEYEDEEDEYDEDDEGEYDDDTEEEGMDVRPGPDAKTTYGPPPPPPPPQQAQRQELANGKAKGPRVNGTVNGSMHAGA